MTVRESTSMRTSKLPRGIVGSNEHHHSAARVSSKHAASHNERWFCLS